MKNYRFINSSASLFFSQKQDYTLSAKVLSVEMTGNFIVTANFEIEWNLFDEKSKKIVWKAIVESSAEKYAGTIFTGTTKINNCIATSISRNIKEALTHLSKFSQGKMMQVYIFGYEKDKIWEVADIDLYHCYKDAEDITVGKTVELYLGDGNKTFKFTEYGYAVSSNWTFDPKYKYTKYIRDPSGHERWQFPAEMVIKWKKDFCDQKYRNKFENRKKKGGIL